MNILGYEAIKIWTLSLFRRLAKNWGHEVSVLIGSALLIAVFAYMARDFLEVQVADISLAMKQSFATFALVALNLSALGVSIRLVRRELTSESSLSRFLTSVGAPPNVVNALKNWIRICLSIGLVAPTCIFGAHWGLAIPWKLAGVYAAATSILALGLAFVIPNQRPERKPVKTTADASTQLTRSANPSQGKLWTLAIWRLRNLLFRRRVSQLALSSAFFLSAFAIYLRSMPLPPFVALFATLASGVMIAAAISFHLAEDLEQAWTEKALGISHDEFVNAHSLTAILIATPFAIFVALGFILAPMISGIGTSVYVAAQAIALVLLAPILAPILAFQIDARRPVVTITLAGISALFLGTAVIAHLAAALVLVIGRSYVASLQASRFYRA